jgi:ABC-type phosphate transport system auxiliary subunit
MLSEIEAEASAMPESRETRAFLAHCVELRTGVFAAHLRKLSMMTPATLIEAEIAEVRQLRADAASELRRVRAEKVARQATRIFDDTLARLRERRATREERLQQLRVEADRLRATLRDLDGQMDGLGGRIAARSAIERLIENNAFLGRLTDPNEPELDDLRRRMTDATVLNLRLKRDLERLRLPTGNSHLARSILEKLSDEPQTTGDWISPVESETIVLKEELRRLQKERDELFRNAVLLQAKENQRPKPQPTPAEIERRFAEIVEMKNEIGTARNLRSFMASFIQKSDELFSLISEEDRTTLVKENDGEDPRREFERRLRSVTQA